MSSKATAETASRHGQSLNRMRARQFAADRQVLTGTTRLADWPRAAEVVLDSAAEITYRVEGGADRQGRPRLLLELTGSVAVTCQRCLYPMEWKLSGQTSVLLAASQRELDAWDGEVEDAEVVLAVEPLNLNDLLEDEFLLGLPFAPMCQDPGCSRRTAGMAQGTVAGPSEDPGEPGPFTALRGKFVSKQPS
jgi:DUF177 domain-containing protein